MNVRTLFHFALLALLTLGCATGALVAETDPIPQQEGEPADGENDASAGGSEPVEAYKNTLRWTTASEVENFGFDVYRGDAQEGPFERLTESPIPGAGTIDTPSQYEYADDTIDPYAEYWYYVESISIHGVREHFTPVFRAKPKLPAEGEESGDEGEGEPGDGAG